MNDKIFVVVKKVALKFDKLSIPLFVTYDLTPSQYKVLRLLYLREPRTVRQIDIERSFAMTNPTVTKILNNLEKKEWIQRIQNPNDSRSKVVCLTPKAESMRCELLGISDRLELMLTEKLTEQEKTELIRLMNKILAEEPETAGK